MESKASPNKTLQLTLDRSSFCYRSSRRRQARLSIALGGITLELSMTWKQTIGAFRILWKVVPVLTIIGLLATNVLSLISATFYDRAYRLLASLPIEQIAANSLFEKNRKATQTNNRLKKRNDVLEKFAKRQRVLLTEARKVSRRIVKRTARNATMNISSVAGESVPYLGAALVVAVTAADLKDGCDTLTDMDEMLSIMDLEHDDGTTARVCGMQVPTVEEVMFKVREDIGGTVSQAKENTSTAARNFYDALGGTIAEILE